MTTDKTVTEREAVMRERAAFVKGRSYAEPHGDDDVCNAAKRNGKPCAWCEMKAEVEYPLPKVTRPRVVRDPHANSYEWSIRERGNAQWRRVNGHNRIWLDPGDAETQWVMSRERITMLADLLANPTETVDER